MTKLSIVNIGKLYTLSGLDGTSGRAAAGIQPIENAELEITDGLVSYAGPARSPSAAVTTRIGTYPSNPAILSFDDQQTVIDARGALVTPGLIDCHTHVIYGGNRAFELPLKRAGVPYLEILNRGGGILSTVRATRAASDEELLDSAAARLMAMAEQGTTTVEIKSGYGLSTIDELRLARLINALMDAIPMSIVNTFMPAHAIPEDRRDAPDGYIDEILGMLEPARDVEAVDFVDVFCEPGVFSIEQTRTILRRAKELDLKVKLHVDEIDVPAGDISGAELAAELGATSADHLRATPPAGFAAMKRAGVVPVVLPATSFCLSDHRYADARTMIDEFDLPVALATDCNPGTSPTESLQLVMTLASLELGMTPEEILAGVTVNAARALDLKGDVGRLEADMLGDAVIWQAYDLDMLPYRFGSNQAQAVIRAGEVICARFEEE